MLIPSDEFKITYDIDGGKAIGRQSYSFVFSDKNYQDDICQARTFDLKKLNFCSKRFGLRRITR